MGNTKPSDSDLRERLTPEQYHVTQERGTERAFTGPYTYNKEQGTYSCIVCGAKLFDSEHKYDSGSGWPSFWLPLAGDRVRTHTDRSLGMVRTWVMFSTTVPSLAACVTASTPRRSASPVRIRSRSQQLPRTRHENESAAARLAADDPAVRRLP